MGSAPARDALDDKANRLFSGNGAKRAPIPIENKCNFLEVTGEVMEHVDPIFFGDPKTAAFTALGLN